MQLFIRMEPTTTTTAAAAAAAGSDDAELDALLQLAEEADGGPTAAAADQQEDEDPLLGLVDAACTADQQTPPPPPAAATAARQKPALCSTKAFSAATPTAGLRSSNSSSKPPAARQQQHQEVQHYVEKLTGIKIKLPRVSGVVLRERYRSVTVVPVSKAAQHPASDSSSWVVIAVLVSKQLGTTSKGAPYSRWRVSDLGGADAQIALFGEAHKEHYAEAEGSVLAFYSPKFSSKGPGGSSSSSSGGLAVSQAAQVELLATSAGWGFCRGTTKAGGRCSNAVDTTVSPFCQYHALQQAKTLRAPVRMGQANQQQQQQQPEAPTAPAASNGKVFDARSKTWGAVSRPAPTQRPTPTAAAGRPGSIGSSSQPGSSTRGGISTGAPLGGGFGSRSTSALPGSLGSSSSSGGSRGGGAAGSGGGSGGGGAWRDAGKAAAAAAAQQAELRESLKAKLQQQSQQPKQPTSSSKAGTRQPGNSSSGRSSGAGFSLLAVMDAVSRGPEHQDAQQQQRLQQQLLQLQAADRPQQAGLGQQQRAVQGQQQQQHHHHQQHHKPQREEQQQQQQQGDGLDALLDELFEDDADMDAADGLVIEPSSGAPGAAGSHQHPRQQQQQQQHKQHASTALAAAGVPDSAAARAASAMARLGAAGPAVGSSSGGLSAMKQADANKRMKVALGMAPKSSLGAGTGGKKTGGGKAAAGVGGSAGGSSGSRPHVSRIGAVGGATVGAAAGGSSVRPRGGSSAAAALVAAAAAARSGAATAAGPGGVGASKAAPSGGGAAAAGGGAGSGPASGFRAMFGRVLQRTDINKPDAKLLGAVSDAAHASMMNKLLDQYEQKDNLAQQLEGITKMEVTAFECRTCKFLTEKRRVTCSGHDVVPLRVTKRWWVCEACGWKLHTLRELMPSKRCPKCRDPEKLFRPTSAYNAPKPVLVNAEAASNPIACQEAMLPRGKEHAFCLNSLQD